MLKKKRSSFADGQKTVQGSGQSALTKEMIAGNIKALRPQGINLLILLTKKCTHS